MQYYALLFLTVAITTVMANLNVGQPLAAGLVSKRSTIEARQTDDNNDGMGDDGSDSGSDTSDDTTTIPTDDTCMSEASSLAEAMPTAAADIASLTLDGASSCVNVPATLTSQWDAVSTSMDSWYDTNSAELDVLDVDCKDYTDIIWTRPAATVWIYDACATENAVEADSTSSTSTKASTTATSTSSTNLAAMTTTPGVPGPTSTAGAAIREVGVVGAIFAGALGAAIAL